ncbi:HAD family hydrolase [Salinithrix halophila]|uniref:HAD family hydrolase n=1 Tax=Salinithrix halophila TaxID=1485204 RepID=A0ABV8JET7_9BACL
MDRPWLSFDLDHTLMINPFRRWVFPEISSWLAPFLGPGDQPMERFIAERKKRLEAQQLSASYDWDDILLTVSAELGVHPPFTIEKLVRQHSATGKIWLFSDVLPGLSSLQTKGIPMVAATNGFAKYQRPVTDHLGLTPYFKDFHTPCSVGFAKPEPQFFRFAEPYSLIHVGDRLDQDILGANRAGAISVWIDRDLPAEWHELSPKERCFHPLFRSRVEEKLAREGWHSPITEENLPNYLIVSIKEVLTIWKNHH